MGTSEIELTRHKAPSGLIRRAYLFPALGSEKSKVGTSHNRMDLGSTLVSVGR